MFIPDSDPEDQKPEPVDRSLEKVIEEAHRNITLTQRAQQPEKDARQRRAMAMRDALSHLPDHSRYVKRGDLVARIKSPSLFRIVDAWVWGDGPLVLTGPTGIGKSAAAAYLVRRLAAEGVEFAGEGYEKALFIRWQRCSELCVAERESELGAMPETIRLCQRARLLVLDELKPTALREPLERVLWHRYDAGLPTITTTELGAAQIESAFGESFLRRLSEVNGMPGKWWTPPPPPKESKGAKTP